MFNRDFLLVFSDGLHITDGLYVLSQLPFWVDHLLSPYIRYPRISGHLTPLTQWIMESVGYYLTFLYLGGIIIRHSSWCLRTPQWNWPQVAYSYLLIQFNPIRLDFLLFLSHLPVLNWGQSQYRTVQRNYPSSQRTRKGASARWSVYGKVLGLTLFFPFFSYPVPAPRTAFIAKLHYCASSINT